MDKQVSIDFTVSTIDFDVAKKIFNIEPPKVDMVYKPDSRWFMPEYHIKNAVVKTMDYSDGIVESSWNAESMELVFAKWYHKPIYWIWKKLKKGKK